jgi:hypothetical protein
MKLTLETAQRERAAWQLTVEHHWRTPERWDEIVNATQWALFWLGVITRLKIRAICSDDTNAKIGPVLIEDYGILPNGAIGIVSK